MMSVTGIQALAACGYLSWLRLRNADASRRGRDAEPRYERRRG